MKKLTTILTLSTAIFAGSAFADKFKPAVVFDFGGKNDASFNEGTNHGVMKFTKETGVKVADFETNNEAEFEQVHRKFAQRGNTPILAVGFTQSQALETVAKQFKNTQFGIIDSVVDLPNVRSYLFKEQEGSFLVGMAAAMKSETDTIGFIGGMDIPLIRAFSCGYEQGARFVNPDINFVENMTGTTGEAWNNPVRGGELAQTQMNKGADIIFAAAGQTGRGVIDTMAEAGKYSIGVDSNQNYMAPGSVLTSMVKRVDVASYEFFTDAKNGKLTAGLRHLGLAEGGVDWALDEHNKDLITEEMKEAIEFAKTAIIEGKINVHDYRTTNSCEISDAKYVNMKK